MIFRALGSQAHLLRAAVALVRGDLPADQREHAESALCLARAYCLLSRQGREYAWNLIVNADLDAPAWQPRLLALELADELHHEAMVQEDDPTFTVERDAQRVHGLDGEALDAYMAAARRLRDLPPVPGADA